MTARSYRLVAAVAIALVTATALQAQDQTLPDPGLPGHPDDTIKWNLHQNNRAVAFGAIIMENGGYSVDSWKELRAFNWCDVIIGKPGDDTGIPIGRSLGERLGAAGDDDGVACWDVLATTDYELVVCPDGRAYVARSGEGVQLVDRRNGELFAWSEGVLCDDDGLGEAAMDANRPLDLAKIRKSPR